MKLTNEQWEKTAVFLQTARPLEQTLYNYHFGTGSVEAVLAALAAFQNNDGGFGHGLEPDLQLTDSSVLATTVAFQILRELGVAKTHPLIQNGIVYLENLYSAEQQSWPFVPETVVNAPRAPWWQYDAHCDGGWLGCWTRRFRVSYPGERLPLPYGTPDRPNSDRDQPEQAGPDRDLAAIC